MNPETQTADPLLTQRPDFLWGMNLHSNAYTGYPTSLMEEQLHLCAQMGCTLIRGGHDGDFQNTDKLVRLCNKYGMKVMICTDPCIKTTDGAYSPENCYTLFYTLASRYNGKNGCGKIDYIQISNEVDNWTVLHDPSFCNGNTLTEYKESQMEMVCERFATAVRGIRDADSDVKSVINVAWEHYGLLTYLYEHGLDWDVVGYDWYEDMAAIYRSRGKRDFEIAETVYGLYHKPILICESNIFKSELVNQEDASNWDILVDIMRDAYRYPFVEGLCFYELCDEMYHETPGTFEREAHYGFVYAERDGAMRGVKPVYNRMRAILGGKDVPKITEED